MVSAFNCGTGKLIVDLTSKDYWEGVWTHSAGVNPLMPESTALNRAFDRTVHKTIQDALKLWGGHPTTLIEIGCGGSRFLPYFARYHGLKVFGLDYCDTGCDTARKALAAQGISGEIIQGDMFKPPQGFSPCDIVYSGGLLEHFRDTAAAVRALRAFLKPGGMMLSIIPNMNGIVGMFQKYVDREVFDQHVPLNAAQFAQAHEAAGLDVLATRYIMTFNLEAVSSRRVAATSHGHALRHLRGLVNLFFWGLERLFGRSFPNRFTSPLIVCIARAPSTSQLK